MAGHTRICTEEPALRVKLSKSDREFDTVGRADDRVRNAVRRGDARAADTAVQVGQAGLRPAEARIR